MKFSKLVLLPLLALGLVACGPASTSESKPSETPTETPTETTPAVPTEWDAETKAQMENSFGFEVPFFYIEDGVWGTDETGELMYMTNPEKNLSQNDFVNKALVPLIQGGLVDSTYKYQDPEDTSFDRVILSHVEANEKGTSYFSILVVYFHTGALGAGMGASLAIMGGVPVEGPYTNTTITDEDVKGLVTEAFGAESTLKLPSLVEVAKQGTYVESFGGEDRDGVSFLRVVLGNTGAKSLVALQALVKAFTDAGWNGFPIDEDQPIAYKLFDKEATDEEMPEYQAVVQVMPDLSIWMTVVGADVDLGI